MASILDLFAGPLTHLAGGFGGGNNNRQNNMMNNQSGLQNNLLNNQPNLQNNMQNQPGSFLGGNPAQTQQFQRFNPQQQNALSQILSQATSGLQNQQPFDFGAIEKQAINNFNTQTVPSLAERFTAMGSGPRSSNYAPAFAAAGSDLQNNLASLRAQYGLQQQGQQQNFLQNLLSQGLTPQFENAYTPREPGFAESAGVPLLQGLAQSLPYLLPLLLGAGTGGAGAVAGGAASGLPLLLKLLQGMGQ